MCQVGLSIFCGHLLTATVDILLLTVVYVGVSGLGLLETIPLAAQAQTVLPQRDQLCLAGQVGLESCGHQCAPEVLRKAAHPLGSLSPCCCHIIYLHLLSSARQRDGLQKPPPPPSQNEALAQVLHDNILLAGSWVLEKRKQIC